MILRKKPEVSLKLRYGIVLKIGLILSLVILISFMVAVPKLESGTSVQKEVKIFIESEEVPITEQKIEQAAPPSRPTIPVESEDEDLAEDFEFEMEGFDDYEADEWAAPPAMPEEDDGGPAVRFIPFDEAPEPIGGFAAIQKNVIYPEIAQEAGIEGTVVVQAFIDENGKVGRCNILKGVPNTGLDEAAVNAIRKTDFIPAMQRDRKVGVWISIPVIFKLRN